MREMILKRIEEIRLRNGGFPSDNTRWKNFTHGTENKNLDEIDFSALNNTELLMLFERLIIRCNEEI